MNTNYRFKSFMAVKFLVKLVPVLLVVAISQPSHAMTWDAKNCNTVFTSTGEVVGGAIGFFGDVIKTILSDVATGSGGVSALEVAGELR